VLSSIKGCSGGNRDSQVRVQVANIGNNGAEFPAAGEYKWSLSRLPANERPILQRLKLGVLWTDVVIW